MSLTAETTVDCTLDVEQDAREVYECTDDESTRDQITQWQLTVLFGSLLLTSLVVLSCLMLHRRIKSMKIRELPRNKLPVDVVSTSTIIGKKMAGVVLQEFNRPRSSSTFVCPPASDRFADSQAQLRRELLNMSELIEKLCKEAGYRERKMLESLRSYMHYVSQELEARHCDASEGSRQSFADAFNSYVCLVEKFEYDEQHDFTQQDFVQLVNVNNVVLSTIKREMSGGQAMIPHTDPAMGLDGLTSPVNARGTVGSVGSSSFLHSHGWGDRPLA